MKKILGILLIILGGLIVLLGLFFIPNTISTFFNALKTSTSETWGYFSGAFIAFLVILGIGILTLIFGIRMTKKSKQNIK